MQQQDSTTGILQPNADHTVTCTHEGVYSDGLTYGNRYIVLRWDPDKQQLRIHNDQGRARWYPYGCFDLAGGEALKIVRITILDDIETPPRPVEVDIYLSDGQRRWCWFVTPEILSRLSGVETFGSGRLLSYNVPHQIIVTVLGNEIIEQSLHYIERQGELLECTLPCGDLEEDV